MSGRRSPLSPRSLAGCGLPGLLLLVLTVPACEPPVSTGQPTQISLSADPPAAAAGDEVTFRYDARGRYLVGVVLDYGDGVADSVRTFGAQTAGGTLSHVYASAGSYQVSAEVLEADGATETADLVLEISAPPSQDR